MPARLVIQAILLMISSLLPALASAQIWLSEEEQQWIKKHPHIVLGAIPDDGPKLVIGSGGKYQGIVPELASRIEAISGLGIEVRPLEVTYPLNPAMLAGVDAYAFITGPGLADAGDFSISDPVLHALISVFARKDKATVVRSMKDLAGHRVAHRLDVSGLPPALLNDSSGTDLIQVQTPQEGFALLQEDKADYFIGVSLDNFLIANFLISDIKVVYMDSQMPLEGGIAVNNAAPQLLSILNKAIAQIGPGELANIANKWIGIDPRSFNPSLKLSERERQWLRDHPSITMGYTRLVPPWLIHEDDRFTGILAEVCEELEALTGLTIEIRDDPWEELVAMAGRREIDGMLLTSNRYLAAARQVSTGPGFYIPRTLYARADSNFTVRRPEDLVGKRVLYYAPEVLNTTIIAPVKERISLQRVASPMDGLSALMANEGDVLVGATSANYLVVSKNIPNIKPIYMQSNPERYAMAVRDDWPLLGSILAKAFDALGQDKLLEIQQRWLAASTVHGSGLTESDLTYISQFGSLAYDHRTTFPPISYLDQNGNPAGIVVDYMQLISDRLGIEIKPVLNDDTLNPEQALRDRSVDISPILQDLPDRRSWLAFTKPYMTIPYSLIAKKDVAIVKTFEDLTGKKIGVAERSLIYQLMLSKYADHIDIHPYKEIEQGFRDLKDGKIDGFIENEIFMDYKRRSMQDGDLKFAGTLPVSYGPTISTRSENKTLITVLNKVLDEISDREKALIYKRWINIPVSTEPNWNRIITWTTSAAIAVLVFIALILYWNRKLAAARIEAEQANQAKSLFLANMSHEIRTPMNAILGFAEILQQDTSLTSSQRQSLDVIQNAGNHLLSLINDILDISKIEAGRVVLSTDPCEIQKLLKGMESMFQISARNKNLQLTFHNISALPNVIHTDEGKIRQILINLIGNAIKFTREGSVRVECECDAIGDDQILVQIHVIDTGAGIEAADLEKVFATFEQTRTGIKTEGGTGLGMAISKAFAQLMGGDIVFQSERGKGSHFTFSFIGQLALFIIEGKQEPGTHPFILAGNHHRVLVVDDKDTNRDLVINILAPMGFELFEAENGLQAITQCKLQKPDLILMDIRMPEMDGITATTTIRALYPELPIIAMTAGVFDKDPDQFRDAGFSAHLDKPFKRADLLGLAAQLLGLEVNRSGDAQSNASDSQIGAEFKVLIVDDVPVNRLLLKKYLEPKGFTCRQSQNGKEALQEISSWHPDLMLLDIQMPVMDGYEVLRELQSLPAANRPAVIAVTAADSPYEETTLQSLGVLAVYQKPVTLDTIEKIITQFIADRAS